MRNESDRRIDIGLLALRSSALFLIITFGRQKVIGFAMFLHSGLPLSSFGFARFLHDLGFPIPGLLAVAAVLNESVVALLIGVGLMCRLSSAVAATGMGVALYVSLRLAEEPFRAVLYFVMFGVLVMTGPGHYSVDHWLQRCKAQQQLAMTD
jgi:uncharacterized membrane protein YphA (DoxX/SURF4 family)